ncbi:leucine-rich repeat-containing protein 15-like [Diachasma alloeum]|uniref:leucine-rich repeat-containing protein 15-like n=1 Tax=Diachasma alloeum TaxID=454923 RepID=UPI00073826DE|nr:leucine-rich repeat-containing protein 15-like [Diachasma alloeum]
MFNIIRDILPLLLIATYVSGACVNVPNQDMMEYACENGYINDLYTIPESTEKIRISNMKIPRITRDTFSRFGDNVLILMCTHCGIEDIEPDSFKALTNLQQLRLDNNHLRTVRASWFEGLKQLTYLDLNYNEIESIEDGVFDNTPELVDLRISGNKLQCLNVDELSRLGALSRIFIAKNPEFKCPNALTKVLEQKQLTFDKDPEWSQLSEDPISPPVSPMRPTTPGYRERLISTRPPDPTVNYYQTTAPNYPPSASYPNYETTSEASHRTSVPWYTTPSYTSEPSYPTRNWPSPTEAKPEVSQTRAPYNEPYYPPQAPRSSTQDPYPYTDDTRYPTGSSSDVTWTGGSDDTFSETDYPPIQPMPPSLETSQPPLREEPDFQTSKPVPSEPKQTSEAQRPPRPLENYQQVEEKAPVAMNLPNPSSPTTAKPKSSSSHSAASAGLVLLTIFYSLIRTF